MQLLHAAIALSMLGGQPAVKCGHQTEQIHAKTLVRDTTGSASIPEIMESGSQEDWEWLDVLTSILCMLVKCDGGTWQPTSLEGEIQTAVTMRMHAQISSYAKIGVAPGLSEPEKDQAVEDAEDTRDFILAQPGMLDESLETDYLLMLEDVIDDLSE